MFFKNKSLKPLDWLKYFCFNFFHNKYAREGVKRSALNAVLGIVIAFVLICGGLTIGYNCSFETHFKNAEEFKRIVHSELSDIKLSANGKNLSADGVIETVSDGYCIITDTRPAAETFDDFTIVCSDGSKEITYKEYKELDNSDKSKYSLNLKYGGKALDTAEKQDEYRAYLDTVTDASVTAKYEALKSGSLSGYELYNEIYKLYARAYYPSFEEVEKYASVPTLRSYYVNEINEKKYDKYLVLFEEYCVCSFYTDGGIAVSFSGSYDMEDGAGDIDAILIGAFKNGSGLNFIVFATQLFVSLIIFVLIALVLSVVCGSVLYKKARLDYGGTAGSFNIICGFVPVSSVIAFLFAIGLSYCAAMKTVYLAVRLIFLCIVLTRFAVLVIMDYITKRKEKKAPETAEGETVESAEPADPFDE